MFEPAKAALGEYMTRFFAQVLPTTKPLQAYVSRDVSKAMMWAPARMVDAADQMLGSYQRNDHDNAPSNPSDLPIIIIAMAKDYVPSSREFTRQIADREWVMLPNDPKQRLFGLRQVAGDIRAQVAIFAADEPTARSLAAQFSLFVEATGNNRFKADYTFAGMSVKWPVQLESTDIPAMAIQSEAKNLTIYAMDLSLHVSVPLFDAPKAGEPNDGKGIAGDVLDPAGYPLTTDLMITYTEARK